ncbi:MAG TPA: PLD nuclease N-terminal domain-containing protein, partial [Blastocatellia bacterium]
GIDRLFYGIMAVYGVILIGTIVLGALSTAFWIWMLIDCITKEPGQSNDKTLWILIIIFLHFLGATLYFAIRRPKRKAELGR